jgi:hypothetical protein
LAAQCPTSATATVDFSHIDKYQSSFGVFNAPNFGLGDVIEIDTAKKVGGRILTVVPLATDTTSTAPIDSVSIASDVQVTVSLSANVGPTDAPAVKAAVSSYAATHSAFALKNFRRVNLTDPVLRLNATTSAASGLTARLQHPSTRVYLIISGLVRAQGAEFQVKDSAGATASATVLKSGNYSLAVSYNHNAQLTANANQGGLFFKANALELDASQHIIARAADLDLRTISFVLGFKSTR